MSYKPYTVLVDVRHGHGQACKACSYLYSKVVRDIIGSIVLPNFSFAEAWCSCRYVHNTYMHHACKACMTGFIIHARHVYNARHVYGSHTWLVVSPCNVIMIYDIAMSSSQAARLHWRSIFPFRLRPIRRDGASNATNKVWLYVWLWTNTGLLVHVDWLHVWLRTHAKLLGYMARPCSRVSIIYVDAHGAMAHMHAVIEHIYDAMVCFCGSRTNIAKHGSRSYGLTRC